MTVTEMHEWFDTIQDKVDTMYFTIHEKDQFINRAIQEFVNDLVSDLLDNPAGPTMVFGAIETTQPMSFLLKPLMYLDLQVVATTGLVSDVDINTALDTAASDTGLQYQTILSVADDTNAPVRFVRHNDYARNSLNEFKQPTATKKVFRHAADGIMVSPTDNGTYYITVIKEPKFVDYDAGIDTDLPDVAHDYVLAQALEHAGIASFDENLLRIKTTI